MPPPPKPATRPVPKTPVRPEPPPTAGMPQVTSPQVGAPPPAAPGLGQAPTPQIVVPPPSALQHYQSTGGRPLDQLDPQELQLIVSQPEYVGGAGELLEAGQVVQEGNRRLSDLTDEVMMGVRGAVDPRQAEAALQAIESMRAPISPLDTRQLRADVAARVARMQALSVMMGRDPSNASALSGLDADELVFRGTHEGQPVPPEVADKLQHTVRWAQGVMEQAYLTPEVNLGELLKPPIPGLDPITAAMQAAPRIVEVARAVLDHRPDAPVGPPRELLDMAPELRDSPPVALEPVALPVQLPAVEDVTAAHAPGAADFEEDPQAAALRQARVVSALSSSMPHGVGRLRARNPDALTLADDPALAGGAGYPVIADEEGRVFVSLLSSAKWEEPALVEVTDLANTGLPADADWEFISEGPVPMKLEGERLVVDKEKAPSKSEYREMLQANVRESFAGRDIEEDPVRFLRDVETLLDRGPLLKIPASHLLENLERYIRRHQAKVPTPALAEKLALPGSKPHQVGKELARALQDWAAIGGMLESAKEVARFAASRELPNPERFPTRASVLNGETPEGHPAVRDMSLEKQSPEFRRIVSWLRKATRQRVPVAGLEGQWVIDYTVGPDAPSGVSQFGPPKSTGVPRRLLEELAGLESGARVLGALTEGVDRLMSDVQKVTAVFDEVTGIAHNLSWRGTKSSGWMLRPAVLAHNIDSRALEGADAAFERIQFNPVQIFHVGTEMLNNTLEVFIEEDLEVAVTVPGGEAVRLTADKKSEAYQEVLRHYLVDLMVATVVHEVSHSALSHEDSWAFAKHESEHAALMEAVADAGESTLARMRVQLMKEMEDGRFLHDIERLGRRILESSPALKAASRGREQLPETISLQPRQVSPPRGARPGDLSEEVLPFIGPSGGEARIRGAGLRGGVEALDLLAPGSKVGKLPYGLHPTGFYSRLRRTIELAEQRRWNPEQLKGYLKGAGISQVEFQWMGVGRLIEARRNLTLQDVKKALALEDVGGLEGFLLPGKGEGERIREIASRVKKPEKVLQLAKSIDKEELLGLVDEHELNVEEMILGEPFREGLASEIPEGPIGSPAWIVRNEYGDQELWEVFDSEDEAFGALRDHANEMFDRNAEGGFGDPYLVEGPTEYVVEDADGEELEVFLDEDEAAAFAETVEGAEVSERDSENVTLDDGVWEADGYGDLSGLTARGNDSEGWRSEGYSNGDLESLGNEVLESTREDYVDEMMGNYSIDEVTVDDDNEIIGEEGEGVGGAPYSDYLPVPSIDDQYRVLVFKWSPREDIEIFNEPHFTDKVGKNAFAHARIANYHPSSEPSGKPWLFMHEIQSEQAKVSDVYPVKDWFGDYDKRSGKGLFIRWAMRDLGKSRPVAEAIWSNRNKVGTYDNFYFRHWMAVVEKLGGVKHDFPFKKIWHEIVLKKHLRYAAENGYAGVEWADGVANAETYNLEKLVDTVSYDFADNMLQMHGARFGHGGSEKKYVPEDELEKYIGRGPAKKIREKAEIFREQLAKEEALPKWVIEQTTPAELSKELGYRAQPSMRKDLSTVYVLRSPAGELYEYTPAWRERPFDQLDLPDVSEGRRRDFVSAPPTKPAVFHNYTDAMEQLHVARGAMERPVVTLEGMDLKAGGEFAKALYGDGRAGKTGIIGQFFDSYLKANGWGKVLPGRVVGEKGEWSGGRVAVTKGMVEGLRDKNQPLSGVAPLPGENVQEDLLDNIMKSMASKPNRRELALRHMETGLGWSKKSKLFQALTPEERFHAMQVRLAGGDLGRWDKGGKFSWRALNPRRWKNTGNYPKYFKEWRPSPEQMTELQKLWDARSKSLKQGAKLAEMFEKNLEQIVRRRKEGGSPYLEVTLDDLLEVGEHLDGMDFRSQIEWANHVLGLYSAPEKAAEWSSVEPHFRNILMDVFQRGVSDGPVPEDVPMDSLGWRLYSSARQRASGLRAHVRLLTRPGHALGPWNQVATPEDFRKAVESGDYDRSVFVNTYKSKLDENEEYAEALQMSGPLARATENSAELDKAMFMAMNLQQSDFGLVDIMPEKDAKFTVNIKGGPKNFEVDLREWAPKLRKFLDGIIERATEVEVERYTLQKATHHWNEEVLREEKQRRELAAAQLIDATITQWDDIPNDLKKKVRRSLSKTEDGDPAATEVVWMSSAAGGMPVRLGTRNYAELSEQYRQSVAEWQRADEKVQELKNGSLYRRGYFPWMHAVTVEDIQKQLGDPYSELSRSMSKEAKNYFLDPRARDAVQVPWHSFRAVWPVYLKVMFQHIHSERAYRKALRRINTLPPWQQHYLRNWIASMRHQDMPIDKIMNQTAQRQMMLEPHLMDEFVKMIVGRDPKQVFKELRAKKKMDPKMATRIRRNVIMLTYFSLLGPIGIPMLNVTEFGFLAHEFLKGPLDMMPRMLPRGARKLPGGKYLPTVNERGEMSAGPAWWVAKGLGQAVVGGSRELLSSAVSRVKNTPQWYSRPTMKGALSMIHEFYGDLFKPVQESKPAKLIRQTAEVWFSLLKGSEYLLRAATMHAIESQLRHHWPGADDKWIAFEAVRRTNDLHAAFGATDQTPFVRGWPMDMWMPFHRWQWGKIEKLALQGGQSARTALGAPMVRAAAKLRGQQTPTQWPPEPDRLGMGMAPPPRYPPGPPPPGTGGSLPEWEPEEWAKLGEWDAPNPNYGDTFGVKEDVAWRHLWALLVGGSATLAFFRLISGFMFTDEWEEGTLFNRLNPFDVRYWKEISSMFWWDDAYTVLLNSTKNVTTGLNAREVKELQGSWQRLMWVIPFLGRIVRSEERELLDKLKELDRDRVIAQRTGRKPMFTPQQEGLVRTSLHGQRPASKVMEYLYGISAAERRRAADLDRMGKGGTLVTPGLLGVLKSPEAVDDMLYGAGPAAGRAEGEEGSLYGEDFFGEDLD